MTGKIRTDELERAASLELDGNKLGGHALQLFGALYRKCRDLEERIESLESGPFPWEENPLDNEDEE